MRRWTSETGTFRTSRDVRLESGMRIKADVRRWNTAPRSAHAHGAVASIAFLSNVRDDREAPLLRVRRGKPRERCCSSIEDGSD
jgi:hypothetical protein